MKFPTLFFTLSLPLSAATTLREVDEGDFSGDHTAPTIFNITPGRNILQFTIGGGAVDGGGSTNGNDADIVRFAILPGVSITSIFVSENINVENSMEQGGNHFFGAEYGPVLTVRPANSPEFQNSLDTSTQNQGLFSEGSDLVFRFPTDPVETFTTIFQETSATRAQVTLEVVAVPEPSVSFFLLSGGMLLVLRRR